MKILNNITDLLRDDLKEKISKGSKVSVAAACFSMYAYEELKKELEQVKDFHFIFTSPTFTKEKDSKQKREFYIPKKHQTNKNPWIATPLSEARNDGFPPKRGSSDFETLNRENSLYGTEFEIKLRNEMTQRAIAKECAEWIKKKAVFKSNITGENMNGFMTVETPSEQTAYIPINGFTTVDLGCERGNNSYNMVTAFEAPNSLQFVQLFENLWNDKTKMQDVTSIVIDNISNVYNENSPEFIYFMTLYHVFSEFLEDISEDVLPNEATGFKNSIIWSMLYDFQRDAVLAIINKLEKYCGCILADSVGLGKTFTALAVIKYYENRNKSVLVLCPKKLAENWNTFKDNYINNPISKDRLNYDVLFHSDLSRNGGQSNGLDLDRLNWGNYDLVVIDESHNFRNGRGTTSLQVKENRYTKLLNKIIKAGVKTKVLMLSATPVNNRFSDLKNQLAIAYEGTPELLDNKLNTKKQIDDIFKQAQTAFNWWSKLEAKERTTEKLLDSLDFDFFELLDSVTIARSRKHIEKYYNSEKIGKFPERLKPISIRAGLTDIMDKSEEHRDKGKRDILCNKRHCEPSLDGVAIQPPFIKGGCPQSGLGDFKDAPPLAGELSAKPTEGAALQSNAVTEGVFISPITYKAIFELLLQLHLSIYTPSDYIFESRLDKYEDFEHKGISQKGREQGIQRLMRINLLKRLESSVYSFNLTLCRILAFIRSTLKSIEDFKLSGVSNLDIPEVQERDFDLEDSNSEDLFAVGKKFKIDLRDMDITSWQSELEEDSETIESLIKMLSYITPEHDSKLQQLFELISNKINNPINDNNKKILIFSAFSDTAEYLYENVSKFVNSKFGLNSAVVTGSIEGRSTIKGLKASLNNVLTCFSPISKNKKLLMPDNNAEIDILIATDCISEGQNLQDCDYLINYDIHWNPVRIIQRFGRIDRIGSKNAYIQLVNFWPDIELDEYINLKSRVETRMKITVLTGTGDKEDDLINEEKGELEYRKQQLKRLQEEVVNIEDMSTGISIMDLGLNEFRLDLLEYIKTHEDLAKKPKGLHSVTYANKDCYNGAIFVLKNINNNINIDNRNRVHPFYMVYISNDGEIICDYLNPKKLLDTFRNLCRGKSQAIPELYTTFNKETDDGRNMNEMSSLLSEAINSIINVKEQSDIDSLFSAGGTSALRSSVSGLQDFELICFLVIR